MEDDNMINDNFDNKISKNIIENIEDILDNKPEEKLSTITKLDNIIQGEPEPKPEPEPEPEPESVEKEDNFDINSVSKKDEKELSYDLKCVSLQKE